MGVNAPFGDASVASLTATGAQAITIGNYVTVIDGDTVPATGNRTLNMSVNSDVEPGALVHIRSKTAGTETTIFGTGITAPTITGVAGKTFTQSFIYDGTTLKPVGLSVQID